MSNFQYQGENLTCENLEIDSITRDLETPFYCYSSKKLETILINIKITLKTVIQRFVLL